MPIPPEALRAIPETVAARSQAAQLPGREAGRPPVAGQQPEAGRSLTFVPGTGTAVRHEGKAPVLGVVERSGRPADTKSGSEVRSGANDNQERQGKTSTAVAPAEVYHAGPAGTAAPQERGQRAA